VVVFLNQSELYSYLPSRQISLAGRPEHRDPGGKRFEGFRIGWPRAEPAGRVRAQVLIGEVSPARLREELSYCRFGQERFLFATGNALVSSHSHPLRPYWATTAAGTAAA
jgi:hypothetical protein